MQRHTGFIFGRQHDAAECLRQLLRYTQLGTRLCDSRADAVDDSVLLCYTPEAVQVSQKAAAIDMRSLLLEATTGDQALRRAPQVLTLRIENTYEMGGDAFWVDARVAWPGGPITITTLDGTEPHIDYEVQAYLVHRRAEDVSVSVGMRSGHYIAYFKHGNAWYLADDERVTRLTEPPKEFPYVVFLARCDRERGRHMSALQKRLAWIRKHAGRPQKAIF